VTDTLLIVIFPVVALLIYSVSLRGPFIFDDMGHIPKNPHIRLERLTLEDLARAGFDSPSKNRVVANMSFAFNYYLDRYNPMGYRLVNILIHAAAGIFLYFFVKTTLNILPPRAGPSMNGWIAFFAALIWLVHPIQTQSVSYIVQRMNSLAAMFYVLSLLLYGRARLAGEKWKTWALFAGCMLSGILALGSKQNAATLPFFIFLYEWYFFQDLRWSWLKRHLALFAGLLILLAIVALHYLGGNPLEAILETYRGRDFTLTERALTQFRVVLFYIGLLIFPHPSRLNLDHDFPISHSLMDPLTTMLSMGICLGLIGLAITMAKRERLLSFCILWFLGHLVIESSVIGLEITFEHRNYLPSMVVGLLAVTFVYRHIKAKRLALVVLCAPVVLFSLWTYERNRVWSDDLALWRDCVIKSPKKARPHNNLGNALMRQERLDEAIRHYREALRIQPDHAKAHNNLGIALRRQGRLKEAVSHYEQALRIRPEYAEAHNNLGVALDGQGRLDEAISHYNEALRINMEYAEAHNNLGVALARQKKLNQAMKHFSEALRIQPDDSKARMNLEQGFRLMGKSSRSRKRSYGRRDFDYHISVAK
jgi:tetratricopeptide (TPR) repeat protein